MTNSKNVQFVEGSRLADVVLSEDDPTRFSEVIDSDGEFRKSSESQWFVCVWPDQCVTMQHIGDAAIHGPYASREECEEVWGSR